MIDELLRGKAPVGRRDDGGVCSKAASGSFSPGIRSRGIAVRRVNRKPGGGGGGGGGVPAGPGGRRNVGGSAAAGRVVGIAGGCVSGVRRSRLPARSPPRGSARASAQPMVWKNFPAPVRAATSCSFLRDGALISGSVRAYVARPCGACSSARRDGDGGGNGGRAVVVGFRRGARRYVAAYCRPPACGPMVARSLPLVAAILARRFLFRSRATGKDR
jgi:hypothetical protein